ncbi:hypothetical protein HMI56_001120 [Coelomomyces lativittatus]|nr:hypothetical protein HMI56_001120 [Coelomomyces lativittatus]
MGTLLVCLEDKKIRPTSLMEMSPISSSFDENILSLKEMETSPTSATQEENSSPSNFKNIKYLRTCLVATPENWLDYMTSSQPKKRKGKLNGTIKYFEVPQWYFFFLNFTLKNNYK